MSNFVSAAYATAPVHTGTVNAATVAAGEPQRLAGTGTTSAQTTVALPTGRYATIAVGTVAIRVRFGASAPTAAATDVVLGAFATFSWYVETSTAWVSIEAADGAAAFEAHAWCSSPQVA